MHSLKITGESTSNNLFARDFTVGEVPGVLWSLAADADRAPLVLLNHGGGNHKKHPEMTGRAKRLVAGLGFHVAVVDSPGHGDRPRTAHDEEQVATLLKARAAGEPEGPLARPYCAYLAKQAVPEWQATLDALQELPEIGADGPVGFFGLNLGTAIGVPLVAAEPRIKAAVFGLHWPDLLAEKARQITIPIEFDMQWDDEDIEREAGLALFDAFASKEKTLHVNAGMHHDVPRFESESAVRFFARHLAPTPDMRPGASVSP
jgi:pimeloyl-ACP methyl ester carboxylesterase